MDIERFVVELDQEFSDGDFMEDFRDVYERIALKHGLIAVVDEVGSIDDSPAFAAFKAKLKDTKGQEL